MGLPSVNFLASLCFLIFLQNYLILKKYVFGNPSFTYTLKIGHRFLFLILAKVGLGCFISFSPIAARGGYSLAALHRLLLLWFPGSRAQVRSCGTRLSCSEICGIFPIRDGTHVSCGKHSLPLSHQGSPTVPYINIV